ncbi:MAG: YeeE/YedE family protein, partial [Dehalococcoidia bacterium]|nr:YeeE/YedE family protein [Dehalococcoidia bacterium]
MVLAGGCATGTLWRMGEGYLNSWVAMGGMLVGLWAASKTWAWWWDNDISKRESNWLPTNLGMPVAILLTLGVLAAIYIGLLWWESRSPSLPAPARKAAPPALTLGDHLKRSYETLFTGKGWSYMAGALALAVLSIAAYNLQSPLGVTGGLALWGDNVAKSFSVGGLPLKGVDALAGCIPVANADWLTIRTMTMSGLVLGAFTASVLSGEFKVRYSRQWARYPQLLIGGGLMGYASVIAVGCTIGAFFSSIPSLAVSGWLFAIALFGGAYVGVQLIRRLP